ncbi:MAG: hypothetical protein JW754_00885 [Candidatus Aenigmarchaeota archaeon]|nr:hypothetical protein [Candidatus Aenigmarchaeota archaeon]
MESGKILIMSAIFISGLAVGLLCSYYFFISSVTYPVEIGPDQIIPVTDQNYFPYVHKILSEANDSVHMIIFDVKYYPDFPDSLENVLLDDLIRLAKNGIKVKVITDQYLTEKPVLTYLRENGIEIKYDTQDRTTHSKLIIIDRKYVFVGSTNWGFYSIEKNHEANVLVYSKKLAEQFLNYFNGIWNEN